MELIFEPKESVEVTELRRAVRTIQENLADAQAPLNDKIVKYRWFGRIMIREDENGHNYEWTKADLLAAQAEVDRLEDALVEANRALSNRLTLESMIADAVASKSESLLGDTFEAIDELFPGMRGEAVRMAKAAQKAIRANDRQIARHQADNAVQRNVIKLAGRLGSKIS